MKKWLKIELVILAVLVVAALVLTMKLFREETQPVLSDTLITTTQETEETEETVQTTTPETTAPTLGWQVPDGRQLTAKQYFVYDVSLETFVAISGNEEEKVYPASITKLFTAHVALQFLKPEQTITAGDALDKVGAGSSVANIQKGDVLTVEQLVAAMLLPSGNDASYLMAVEAGKIIKNDPTLSATAAVQAFMAEMNGQARALGMTGTHFTNPDGYHSSSHYTNMQDLTVIGKLALNNATIRKYAKVSYMSMPNYQGVAQGEEDMQGIWKNTNALIDPESVYYHPEAVGLKTGQTPSAGSCLLSAFEKNGNQYIIGVFGCPEVEDRFEDTLQLYQLEAE